MKHLVLALSLLAASVVALPLQAKQKDPFFQLVDVTCVNPIFQAELFSVKGVYIKRDNLVLELTTPVEPPVTVLYPIPQDAACVVAPAGLNLGDNNNNDG